LAIPLAGSLFVHMFVRRLVVSLLFWCVYLVRSSL